MNLLLWLVVHKWGSILMSNSMAGYYENFIQRCYLINKLIRTFFLFSAYTHCAKLLCRGTVSSGSSARAGLEAVCSNSSCFFFNFDNVDSDSAISLSTCELEKVEELVKIRKKIVYDSFDFVEEQHRAIDSLSVVYSNVAELA